MEAFEKLEIEKTITGGIEMKGSLFAAIDLLEMLGYISEKLLDIRMAAVLADAFEKNKNVHYEHDIDLEKMNAFIEEYKIACNQKDTSIPPDIKKSPKEQTEENIEPDAKRCKSSEIPIR